MRPTDKTLLILDLDETLIHATEMELAYPADFKLDRYFVYQRPFLRAFIDEMKEYFQLAVWSSASDDYVQAISDKIFTPDDQLRFVWGRSRCTYRRNFEAANLRNYSDHYQYIKVLKKVKKLGFDLTRILIVDDTPHKAQANYGNAIYPKPYEGDPVDYELQLLAEYLKRLSEATNVRKIEKRGWRTSVL